MSTACASCGQENAAGRKFCGGCGAPLGRTCPGCGCANDPGMRFCGECGTSLVATPAPTSAPEPEGERKQLTVLFADVQGSMELQAELDVEAWARIVERFVRILAEGVRRFGGTVDKFTGDGIMALFGAPLAQEDHARRACHAAWQLTRDVRSYAEELRRSEGVDLHVRIGLNSGEAVVGRVGDDLRIDPTALGHTVGLAQRMEALAVPGSGYLTEHTARLVEGWFRLRDLGPMTVKGAREPLGVHILEGPSPPRASRRGAGTARLVGRASEMARLEEALSRAAEGHAQVVGVVGEPGVGKSRLCDEFARSVIARGITMRRTAGVSHGREVPLLPILAFFRDYFGITDADTPGLARERIGDRLLALDPSFAGDLPLFFDFLEVPDPERPAPQLGADVRMRRILEVVRRLTSRRSERELLVMVFEDLHWMDPQSEAFLARVIDGLLGTRTLVVANFRPEFSAAWMRHSYYQQLALVPLSAAAVAEMLGDLLGDDPSLGPLPAYLVERTGGNPFFVEEVVRALVEDGTLAGRPGGHHLTRPLEQARLPASVQAVLAARIDRLSAEHKPVLQSAAVIGRTFPEAVLARVTGSADEALTDALSALCAAELVQEARRYPVVEYRFWHPLTQEVAYGTMLAARRARLHAAVAEALTEQGAGGTADGAAVVAWHWERAGSALEAARWNLRAGGFALSRDLSEGLRRLQAAVDLLEGGEETPDALDIGVRARIRLLQFGARAGLAPDEIERLEVEGMERAQRLANPPLTGMLLLASGSARFGGGDLEGGLARWLELARWGEGTADPDMRAVMWYPLSFAPIWIGPLAQGLAWADRTLEVCAGSPERGSGLLAYSVLGRTLQSRARLLARMGRLAEARTDLERALDLARSRDETESLCWGLAVAPLLGWLTGDERDTSAPAAEAVHLAEETGNPASLVLALEGMALAELTAARPAATAAACDRALAVAREYHAARFTEAPLLTSLALARVADGDAAAAAQAAELAVVISRRQGARVPECLALLARGKALGARDGPTDAAFADLRAALACVAETGASTYEPFIREELGRLRSDEGELREAARLYTAVGAHGHARRLEGELTAATADSGARGSIS